MLEDKVTPLYPSRLAKRCWPLSWSATQKSGNRWSSRLTRISISLSARFEGPLMIWIRHMIKKRP